MLRQSAHGWHGRGTGREERTASRPAAPPCLRPASTASRYSCGCCSPRACARATSRRLFDKLRTSDAAQPLHLFLAVPPGSPVDTKRCVAERFVALYVTAKLQWPATPWRPRNDDALDCSIAASVYAGSIPPGSLKSLQQLVPSRDHLPSSRKELPPGAHRNHARRHLRPVGARPGGTAVGRVQRGAPAWRPGRVQTG